MLEWMKKVGGLNLGLNFSMTIGSLKFKHTFLPCLLNVIYKK